MAGKGRKRDMLISEVDGMGKFVVGHGGWGWERMGIESGKVTVANNCYACTL